MIFEKILGVDVRLGLIAWLPTDAPWERIRAIPPAGAAHYEKLRDFLVVQVVLNSGIRLRAERRTDEQNLVLFDELADHFRRFPWIIGVIRRNKLDLAAVDAAFRVNLREVGGNRLA